MLYEYKCPVCGFVVTMKRTVKDRDIPVYCTCSTKNNRTEIIENPHIEMSRVVLQKFTTSGLDHNVT